jgi:hypothetical protein
MENDALQQLGERYLPLAPEQLFAPQRAAPNPETGDGGKWFGDELPPTYQDFLNSPAVKRAKTVAQLQMLQRIAQMEQQLALRDDPRLRKQAARQYKQQLKTRSRQAS